MRLTNFAFLGFCILLLGSVGMGCASGGRTMDSGRPDVPSGVDAPGLDVARLDVPPGVDSPSGVDSPPPPSDTPMVLMRDAGRDAPVDSGGVDAGRPDVPPPECTTAGDCSDGVACNGVERCEFGMCVNGSPVVCDDGISCTTDSCVGSGCTYTPVDSLCGSGMRCTSSGCMTTGGCAESPCRLVPPQCGCSPGQSCILNGGARTCGLAGSGSEGGPCTLPTDCAAGLACVNFSASGSGLMCSRMCAGDSDCTSGGLCLNEVMGGAVRLCTRPCNPVNQTGCAPGLLCTVFRETAGAMRWLTDCTGPPGGGVQGASCFDESDCAGGYACVDVDGFGFNTCVHWCNAVSGVGCSGGTSCFGFTIPIVVGGIEYGVCA